VELPTALTKFNGRAATGGQSYSSLTFLYILPDDEEVVPRSIPRNAHGGVQAMLA
jgi:hypothetical protein